MADPWVEWHRVGVPFSELLHHPAATARRLDAVRAFRLRRRDAEDLALMRVDQMEQDAAVVDFTSRLLTGLVCTGNIDALRQALPEALPWSTFLPAEDVDTLLAELVETARGAVSLDRGFVITKLRARQPGSDRALAGPMAAERGDSR